MKDENVAALSIAPKTCQVFRNLPCGTSVYVCVALLVRQEHNKNLTGLDSP